MPAYRGADVPSPHQEKTTAGRRSGRPRRGRTLTSSAIRPMIEQAQKYAYRCKMDFLTTSEAAEYVRLGERKLYELVTSGAIPCSKVAGKWLFPRHELDLWVLSGMARPAGMIAADPPPT